MSVSWQHVVTAYAPGRIMLEETFFLTHSVTALALASLTFENGVLLQLLRLMGPARQLMEIIRLVCERMTLASSWAGCHLTGRRMCGRRPS
jgi:hypothetical protein